MIPLQMNLGGAGYTTLQVYFAIAVVFFAVIGFLILYFQVRKSGMEEWRVSHLRAILNSERNANKHHFILTYEQDKDEIAQTIASGLTGKTQVETFSDAKKKVRTAIDSKFENIPDLPFKLALEGILFVIIGTAIFVPLSELASLLESDVSLLALFGKILGDFVSVTLTVPIFKMFSATVLVAVISIGKVLYGQYLFIGLTLLLGSFILYGCSEWLEGVLTAKERKYVVPSRLSVLKVVLSVCGFVWASAVIPYNIAVWYGFEEVGTILSGVLAVVGVLVGFGYIARTAVRKIRLIERVLDETEKTDGRLMALYLISEYFWKVFAVAMLPFLLTYVIQLFTSGRIWELYTAAQTAPTWVKAVLLGFGLCLGFITAYELLDVVGELRTFFRTSASRYAVKGKALYGGFPIIVGFAAFIGSLSVTSVSIAVIVSAVAAVTVRAGLIAVRRMRAKMQLYDRSDTAPGQAYGVVYMVSDARNREYPVLNLNGATTLMGKAGETPQDFADRISTLVRNYFETGKIKPSVDEYHYSRAKRFGLPGWEYNFDSLENETEEAIEEYMRQHGPVVNLSEIKSLEKSVPPEVLESKLYELDKYGVLRLSNPYVIYNGDHRPSGKLDWFIRRVLR